MRERKTVRRAFRPGGGEYAPGVGHFSALNDLRARFMTAAFACKPELEKSLRTLYETSLRGNVGWLEADLVGDVAPPSKKAVDLARGLLKPWSERVGLSDDWCVNWVLAEKLFVWWAQERKQFGVVTSIWFGPRPLKPVPLRVDFEPWDRTGKTRTRFESEARERFGQALSGYCDRLELEAPSAGYVRTKERRNSDHFLWLAGYQVCRFSYTAIADAFGPWRQAVQSAVGGLAKEIGLTLRGPAAYRRSTKAAILAALRKSL